MTYISFARISFLLGMLLFPLATWAQSADANVAIGQWRSHLAYTNSVAVTQSETAVYYGTNEAVLKVNKADQSVEYINKVTGMSDMNIKTIEYNRDRDLLVVAYTNGNVDLRYEDGTVTNLAAIKNNTNILGNKEINHIYCIEERIYFSCSFGFVIYDLDLNIFKETVFTPNAVNASAQLGNTIFISTNQGIYTGIMDGRNLQDFTIWELANTVGNDVRPSFRSRGIINFANTLYTDYNDSLVYYANGTWNHISGTIDGTPITKWAGQETPVNGSNAYTANHNFSTNWAQDQLIITTNTYFWYTIDQNNNITKRNGGWNLKELVIDQNNDSWQAQQGSISKNFASLNLNAPQSNLISDLHWASTGKLWVTFSRYNPYYAAYNGNERFGYYEEGFWTNYKRNTQTELNNYNDCRRIISNTKDGNVYIGSRVGGLLKMAPDGSIEIFNKDNSPLQSFNGDPGSTRVFGLAEDSRGNVWMTNSLVDDPLAVRKRNGDWKIISGNGVFTSTETQYLTVDRNGYIWVQQITGQVIVFDPGDIDDDTDDTSIVLGENNTELPTNKINCLEADNNGVVWIGTDQGITIFNCSSSIFDGNCQGNRPIISQDNFNGYLLEGESIKDIAVDGANRKWVATTNGVFLLSEDGEEQLLYFTAENSPLFDNEVTHVTVDGESGAVYIATSVGLQSFRSDATTGQRRMEPNCDGITIFPHPVEPDYRGPIAISGLVDQANVKITDISGRLMYETTALGGQAVWYGTDYNGRRAQSGVYLVLVVDSEGTQQAVCKILFLN